jgi:hypothetical protein
MFRPFCLRRISAASSSVGLGGKSDMSGDQAIKRQAQE